MSDGPEVWTVILDTRDGKRFGYTVDGRVAESFRQQLSDNHLAATLYAVSADGGLLVVRTSECVGLQVLKGDATASLRLVTGGEG